MAGDLARYTKRSTVQLTTVGRTSGLPRTVKVWFVVVGPQRIAVQHVRGADANWYRNLSKNAAVQVDFGDGAIAARAIPVTERSAIRRILALIRRKYLMAWVLQACGTRNAVAAEIELEA